MLYILTIIVTVFLTALYQNVRSGQTIIINRNKKFNIKRIAIGFLIILILSLLCGLRGYSVGTDTNDIYYPYYFVKYCVNNVPYGGTEYLFYSILKIGYALFGSYTGVLFLISFLTLLFAFIGLAYYEDRISLPLGMLLYLSFIYFESFNIMRQILALSIIIFAFRYLEKRNYLSYLFWCIVAALIHNTSIVSIGLLFIYLSLNNKTVYRVFLFLICLLPILLPLAANLLVKIPVLTIYFQRYQFKFEFSLTNLAYVIYFLPAFAICLNFRSELVKKDKKNKFYLAMLLLVFICGLFKLYMVWVSRLLHYFSFSVCVLLPQCVGVCRNKQNKNILKVLITLYCVVYFILFYLVLGNGEIYPYVFCFGA